MDLKQQPRLRLKLADAARSTLTPAAVVSLRAALRNAASAPLVTLEGEVGTFCAGLDLETATVDVRRELASFAALITELEVTPRPVVALVDGEAMGGGVGLAAAADVVIATPRATFSLPETLMGLIPAVVLPTLARRIGMARTRLLALGAPPLSAEDAFRAGLVDVVTQHMDTACDRYAARFGRIDRRAFGHVKFLVSQYRPPRRYVSAAIERFASLWESPATRDRLKRFVTGWPPWDNSSDDL